MVECDVSVGMFPFAVISDVHGNLTALEAALDRLEHVEKIFVLGDLVGIGPQPSEVLELIGDRRFECVMGNHDHNTAFGTELGPLRNFPRRPHHDWVRSIITKKQIDLLRRLPMTLKVETPSGMALMMHSHPEDCGGRVPYFRSPTGQVLDDFYSGVPGDMVFFGHTHIYLKIRGRSGRWYVNPGAVGAENGGNASFVTVDEELNVERVRARYDLEHVRRLVSMSKMPNKAVVLDRFFGRS